MPITIGFSALQRAENSSIEVGSGRRVLKRGEFQCSSASRKFLNCVPSSRTVERDQEFQCSSASRKFLNTYYSAAISTNGLSFSALQRAENSSILGGDPEYYDPIIGFSALQRAENSSMEPEPEPEQARKKVSVLFSEPKIPQSSMRAPDWMTESGFSALQRAENSSICAGVFRKREQLRFSALQRAENSSIYAVSTSTASPSRFSALQRAENSSIR